MRLQLEEGCGAGGKRTKTVSDLERVSGTLDDILYNLKQPCAFIISTCSDEMQNVQVLEDEDCLLRVQRFVLQELFGESEHGHSLFITVDLLFE